jgi:hypothetical protein
MECVLELYTFPKIYMIVSFLLCSVPFRKFVEVASLFLSPT